MVKNVFLKNLKFFLTIGRLLIFQYFFKTNIIHAYINNAVNGTPICIRLKIVNHFR